MRTLPKPARVEKWQRWRDQGREYVIGEHVFDDNAWEVGGGAEVGEGILGSKYWIFLGYAKPDRVEAGQRWRSKTCGYDVRRKMAHPRRDDVWELLGEDRVAMDSTETEIRGWEYLGMAESADAKKEAPRSCTGLQSVIAAKTEYVTVDDLSAPPVQTKRTADQARQDARRANEEVAKRLIANPPEWAYTKAWMCAVLAEVERSRGVAYQLNCYRKTGAATLAIKDYHFARLAGKTHEAAMLCVELNHHIVEVYARGMVKPAGLMGRPGVKGGMSTCDLGVDYE